MCVFQKNCTKKFGSGPHYSTTNSSRWTLRLPLRIRPSISTQPRCGRQFSKMNTTKTWLSKSIKHKNHNIHIFQDIRRRRLGLGGAASWALWPRLSTVMYSLYAEPFLEHWMIPPLPRKLFTGPSAARWRLGFGIWPLRWQTPMEAKNRHERVHPHFQLIATKPTRLECSRSKRWATSKAGIKRSCWLARSEADHMNTLQLIRKSRMNDETSLRRNRNHGLQNYEALFSKLSVLKQEYKI